MAAAASLRSAVKITDGFAPIANRDARVLVLGTLPSQLSLQTGQYYGNPRNAFWPIMSSLLATPPDLPYAKRVQALLQHRIAAWDVLASSERPGSLDSAIDWQSARANDFAAFFAAHTHIGLVCFNGQTAAKLYRQLVAPVLEKRSNSAEYRTLPSTSPAHASMTFAEKLRRWSIVKSSMIE